MLAAALSPVPAGARLEVEGAELIYEEGDFGLARLGYDLAVGNCVELLAPGLRGGVVGAA